jgi:hypothetical protein
MELTKFEQAKKMATHFANQRFWLFDNHIKKWFSCGFSGNFQVDDTPYIYDDFQEIPKQPQWPETDERINNIGRNRTEDDMGHYNRNADEALNSELSVYAKPTEPKTAVEFLNACVAVQSERGKQYDASGTGERSFAAAASAFNAATGKSLTGSDVCLLLTMVKLVRQYSSPDRLHQDSLLDGVSYLSLWAEELTNELGEK